VHVHTLQPGAVLSLATELGEIVKVKVDNMQLQHQEFAAVSSQPRRSSEPTSFSTQHPAPSTRPRTGLVAVALGEGLQRIFASLGAELVSGGQTMNPSVEELLTAIRRSPAEDVIVLPNNPNIVATAQQAASLVADGNVAVVPTYSLPQGISAALALNPEASLRQNAATLTEIAARCHCIELTRAVRAARLGDLEIRVGATMAIVDGRPAASGANYHELIATAVDQLPAGRYEIATVYVGADGTPAEADQLAAALSSRLGIPTEVQAGGQPHYAYIISVE
jgi:hypothetical protein